MPGPWVALRVVRYPKRCVVCHKPIGKGSVGCQWNPETKQLRHGYCTAAKPKPPKKPKRPQKRVPAAEPRVGWAEATRGRGERRRAEGTAMALERVANRQEAEARAVADLAAHPCSMCPLRDVGGGREYPVGHHNDPWPRLASVGPIVKRALGVAVEGRGAVRTRLDAAVASYCSVQRERFGDDCGAQRAGACYSVIAAAVVEGVEGSDDGRPMLDWIVDRVQVATTSRAIELRVGKAAERDAGAKQAA